MVEMNRMPVPGWVRDLVHQHSGNEQDPSFIMTKSLTKADMDFRNQNRLLIPSPYVDANLIPMLSEAEKAAANLLESPPTARRSTPSTSRVQGRRHGGLEVRVYTRSRFWFRLVLTRWDSTGSTLIKGSEYKVLLDRSFLRESDEVEMWGFRQGGQLCFVLGRSIVPPV